MHATPFDPLTSPSFSRLSVFHSARVARRQLESLLPKELFLARFGHNLEAPGPWHRSHPATSGKSSDWNGAPPETAF